MTDPKKFNVDVETAPPKASAAAATAEADTETTTDGSVASRQQHPAVAAAAAAAKSSNRFTEPDGVSTADSRNRLTPWTTHTVRVSNHTTRLLSLLSFDSRLSQHSADSATKKYMDGAGGRMDVDTLRSSIGSMVSPITFSWNRITVKTKAGYSAAGQQAGGLNFGFKKNKVQLPPKVLLRNGTYYILPMALKEKLEYLATL